MLWKDRNILAPENDGHVWHICSWYVIWSHSSPLSSYAISAGCCVNPSAASVSARWKIILGRLPILFQGCDVALKSLVQMGRWRDHMVDAESIQIMPKLLKQELLELLRWKNIFVTYKSGKNIFGGIEITWKDLVKQMAILQFAQHDRQSLWT